MLRRSSALQSHNYPAKRSAAAFIIHQRKISSSNRLGLEMSRRLSLDASGLDAFGPTSRPLLPSNEPVVEATSGGVATYTAEDAIEHMGFGKFQWGMLGYVGLIWFADAMELMMLSFIGPAVRAACGEAAAQPVTIRSRRNCIAELRPPPCPTRRSEGSSCWTLTPSPS